MDNCAGSVSAGAVAIGVKRRAALACGFDFAAVDREIANVPGINCCAGCGADFTAVDCDPVLTLFVENADNKLPAEITVTIQMIQTAKIIFLFFSDRREPALTTLGEDASLTGAIAFAPHILQKAAEPSSLAPHSEQNILCTLLYELDIFIDSLHFHSLVYNTRGSVFLRRSFKRK